VRRGEKRFLRKRRRQFRKTPESTLIPRTRVRCSRASAGRRPTRRLLESSERGSTRICPGTWRQNVPRGGHVPDACRPLCARRTNESSLSEERDAFAPSKNSRRAKRNPTGKRKHEPGQYRGVLLKPRHTTLNQQAVSSSRPNAYHGCAASGPEGNHYIYVLATLSYFGLSCARISPPLCAGLCTLT